MDFYFLSGGGEEGPKPCIYYGSMHIAPYMGMNFGK